MNVADHLDGLCLALTEGRPVVLLLGQDAWRSGTHADPVLDAAFKRLGRRETSLEFPKLLQENSLPSDFYGWLAEIYSAQPEQEWMAPVSRLPLNAVFTSSIDPAITRALRINGRDVELVLSKMDNPATPRNRQKLHLTYLFGRAGESNPEEAPPSSLRELRQRTAVHATSLLSRMLETTTPLGVLLIDGLNCDRDWLNAEALSGILSAFSVGQVYWFGWDSNQSSPYTELVRDLAAPVGPITFVRERLAASLASLELAHRIDISSRRIFGSEGSVSIGDRVLDIEPAMRLKVSTVASIVEDSWTMPLQALGSEVEYGEFRRFHGQVEDGRRLVEGIRRGYAIERTFESELRNRVNEALLSAGRQKKPVLIHGQSGTGKSVALARLAYKIRKDAKYPVLFASRVSRMPAIEELDDFCLQAEEAGAEATLVICDANMPSTRYSDLLRGFASRGRRVVVVGSAYRIIDDRPDSRSLDDSYLLEVPAELDGDESNSLQDLVLTQAGVTLRNDGSAYMLSVIYRILPFVRPRLAAGLAREASVAEDHLRARGRGTSAAPPNPASPLGAALVDAGLIAPKTLLDQKIGDFLGDMSDAASKAIDLVMLPGKLDCPVPVNLLTRTVGGSENMVDITQLFAGIDLFRWSLNDEGDVFLHPRLQVEAELITARRLGTTLAEVEIALSLLRNASPNLYGSCERRFVLDFVHRLGPDGPYGRRYADHYLEIARALTLMRTKRGLLDPSLMLQEATLRRRFFRDAAETLQQDTAWLLEEARQIVDLALDHFDGSKSRGLRRSCANLKVERAAIYGFRAVQRLKSGAKLDEVWQYYKAARDSARNAVFAADSYFAIDISVWVPSDILRLGAWDEERRVELIADIWDGIERVDSSQLDPEEQERFEERRVKVAQTLDDNVLEKSALEALDRMGSKAGVFLRARSIGGPLWGIDRPTPEDLSAANRVISFMRDRREKIEDDARCLRYFLRGLWIAATGNYLFSGERSPLPEGEEALREILSLLEVFSDLEGSLGDPRTRYLHAVLLWKLRQEHRAREIWNLLSRDTAFSDPRRVVRHHVWTESDGQPRLFHGRVKSDSLGQGRVRVQVDELRQEVELLQRDFPALDLRRGGDISGGFHIAFNFIGPVADPPRRPGGGR